MRWKTISKCQKYMVCLCSCRPPHRRNYDKRQGVSLAEACWSYGEAKLLSPFFVAEHCQVPERQQLKIFTLKLKNRFLGSWLQLLWGLWKRKQCLKIVSKQVHLCVVCPEVQSWAPFFPVLHTDIKLSSANSLFPLIWRWHISLFHLTVQGMSCKFRNEWLGGSNKCFSVKDKTD